GIGVSGNWQLVTGNFSHSSLVTHYYLLSDTRIRRRRRHRRQLSRTYGRHPLSVRVTAASRVRRGALTMIMALPSPTKAPSLTLWGGGLGVGTFVGPGRALSA